MVSAGGIVVASLVRDEMARFFPKALRAWNTFAREIVILDDNSSDGSREHALDFGARVVPRGVDEPMAWGAESPARRTLFEAAWGVARVDDYILWLDADMTPARDPRVLTSSGVDAIFFRLFDLWGVSPYVYREDRFWRAHHTARLWMIRKTSRSASSFFWPRRGIHSGHLPEDFTFESAIYAPRDFSLLHFAYAAPELREDKYASYASVASDLTDHERAHARSILDESPTLVHLEFQPELTLASDA